MSFSTIDTTNNGLINGDGEGYVLQSFLYSVKPNKSKNASRFERKYRSMLSPRKTQLKLKTK